MPDDPMMHDAAADGSLIRQLAKRCVPPAATEPPGGTFTRVYEDRSSHGLGGIGRLTISRQVLPEGGLALRIGHSRRCVQGFMYHAVAELVCAEDTLCTPRSWTVDTKIAKLPDDPPYLDSGLRKTGELRDGVLRVTTGEHTVESRIDGAATCKWCLLEAVGRLPAEAAPVAVFTLIDEYDETAPGQRLRFAGTVRLPAKTGELVLACYHHTGRGVVPASFWVDPGGRPLFHIAGMQTLVLVEENGVPVEVNLP